MEIYTLLALPGVSTLILAKECYIFAFGCLSESARVSRKKSPKKRALEKKSLEKGARGKKSLVFGLQKINFFKYISKV